MGYTNPTSFTVTLNELSEYSPTQKQKLLAKACKEALIEPRTTDINIFNNHILKLLDGTMITCSINNHNQSLCLQMRAKTHLLTEFKKRFDQQKLNLLKDKSLILETSIIDNADKSSVLELTYFVLPYYNIYPLVKNSIMTIR